MIVDVVVIALLTVGTLFVAVGTLGLLRFPDLPTRLHAVAKADNLGLGFIVLALTIHAIVTAESGWGIALKLILIWLLALLGTAANSHLLARRADSEPGTARADGTGPALGGSAATGAAGTAPATAAPAPAESAAGEER